MRSGTKSGSALQDLGVVLLAACAQTPPQVASTSPTSDSPHPMVARPDAPDPERAAEEAPGPIHWSFAGTCTFESCDPPPLRMPPATPPASVCWRYRVVVRACPGPCEVQLDVDGPGVLRRLTGVGAGTADRYALAIRFRATRDGDRPDVPIGPDSLLVALRFGPGGQMSLHLRSVRSPPGVEWLAARRGR